MARLVFSEKPRENYQKYKVKHHKGWRSVSLLLEPSNKQWWEDPDVVVAFNLPRISAALEKLMGTNVVRLTDHNYMKLLRERINEDYRKQLEKRIKARELKEVERERLLIIEGKSDTIPAELADDPIFVVNKAASIEIQKQRAKLKTNRERNSERLKLQGVKWERERLQHEEEERQRLEQLQKRRQEQKQLEERYKAEDAVRAMDLLRIDNEDWRPCEQELKEFLERERAKMKERFLRKPIQFASDPRDIQNIIKARKKFRQAELRVRKQLDEKPKPKETEMEKEKEKRYSKDDELGEKSGTSKMLKLVVQSKDDVPVIRKSGLQVNISMDPTEEEEEDRLLFKYSDDASHMSSESDIAEVVSSISESKRRCQAQLQEELDDEVAQGLIISKDQYEHLRYEEGKIKLLRRAKNIRELYQIAEEIIIGERIEEEIIEEEEGEEEDIGPSSVNGDDPGH